MLGVERVYWSQWSWKSLSEWQNVWIDAISFDGNDRRANHAELALFSLSTVKELVEHSYAP